MQRRAPLRAGLRQNKSTIRKIKRKKRLTASEFRMWRPPMQTPRNHQMNDKPKIAFRAGSAFDADRDALADAADLTNHPAIDRLNRRVRGAQHKDALQPDAFQLLTKNARLKRGDVSSYVRQLR